MARPADLSPRCRQFLADLDALCARYGVHITPSGNDRLAIRRVHIEDTGGFDMDAIDDHTEESSDAPR